MCAELTIENETGRLKRPRFYVELVKLIGKRKPSKLRGFLTKFATVRGGICNSQGGICNSQGGQSGAFFLAWECLKPQFADALVPLEQLSGRGDMHSG
jgi:hypothetical protein